MNVYGPRGCNTTFQRASPHRKLRPQTPPCAHPLMSSLTALRAAVGGNEHAGRLQTNDALLWLFRFLFPPLHLSHLTSLLFSRPPTPGFDGKVEVNLSRRRKNGRRLPPKSFSLLCCRKFQPGVSEHGAFGAKVLFFPLSLIWESVLMCSLGFVPGATCRISPSLISFICRLSLIYIFTAFFPPPSSSSLSSLQFLSVAQRRSTFSCTIIYLYRISFFFFNAGSFFCPTF